MMLYPVCLLAVVLICLSATLSCASPPSAASARALSASCGTGQGTVRFFEPGSQLPDSMSIRLTDILGLARFGEDGSDGTVTGR